MSAAWAKRPRPDDKEDPADKAAQLLTSAKSALAAGALGAAGQQAVQVLRTSAAAESLLILGRIAQTEGRTLDAHDFLRRYLAAPELDLAPDDPESAQIRQVLASPRPPSAQLYVTGDRGTVVVLDRRPVAVLPLSRPLLIAPGEHALVLERGPARLEDQVRVPVSRLGEVRANFASKALVLTILPGVLLVEDGRGFSEAGQLRLTSLVEGVLVARRLSPIPLSDAQFCGDEPAPGDCADEVRCNAALAKRCESDLVLQTSRIPDARDPRHLQIQWQVIDVQTADIAASDQIDCRGCTEDQLMPQVGPRLAALLDRALARGRGQLILQSTPPGAQLRIDGREVGPTPFSGLLLAGPHHVELVLSGYQSQQSDVDVPDGREARLDLTLDPVVRPTVVQVVKRRRPLWRVVTGATLLGAGLVVAGFGVAALSVDGTQTLSQCGEASTGDRLCTFRTRGLGLGLLVPGLALSVGGALLWAIPPTGPQSGGGNR
ncbi:MAG TPA: PEGA domain-containing protein [Pseudomonadota bacterium]|nr:PEGA domain-containing protein [Pseudomonadota bacterium]